MNETGSRRDLGAWRRELRAWFEDNAPSPILGDPGEESLDEGHRAWERELYDAGYAAIHWPREHGGQDADIASRIVFQEEYERVGAPPRLNPQGLMLAGPTLIHYGTKEQCDRWIGPMLRNEQIWCQGFSEPEAGSDLANVQTRGVLDGDHYVLNGQKTWTSGALTADWCFALVRTNTDAPKHRGITWIMIDLATPGVEIRPIQQMNGMSGFCEVFFADARVPADNVVGGVDNGWQVAMTALGFERGVGSRSYVKFLRELGQLRSFVEARGLSNDESIRQELGQLFRQVMVYKHHVDRTVGDSVGGKVGPEASFNKLYWSEMQCQMHGFGMRVLGEIAEIQDDALSLDRVRDWQDSYWYSRAARIFAGTNEIQKNIIAERVLGLPKEPRK